MSAPSLLLVPTSAAVAPAAPYPDPKLLELARALARVMAADQDQLEPED